MLEEKSRNLYQFVTYYNSFLIPVTSKNIEDIIDRNL